MNEKDLLISVFQIKIFPPKPALPQKIITEIPRCETKSLKKADFSNEEIFEKLKLNPSIRLSVIKEMQKLDSEYTSTERNQNFISLFIIQSFFAILIIENINLFKEETVIEYIQSLLFAAKLTNEYRSYIHQITVLLTKKLETCNYFYSVLPFVDSLIENLEQYEEFLPFFMNSINFIATDDTKCVNSNIKTHVKLFLSILPKITIPDSFSKDIELFIFTVTNSFSHESESRKVLCYMLTWVAFELAYLKGGYFDVINASLKKELFEKKFFEPNSTETIKCPQARKKIQVPQLEQALSDIDNNILTFYQSISFINEPVIAHLFNYYAGWANEESEAISLFLVFLCRNVTKEMNVTFKQGNINSIFFNKYIFDPHYSIFVEPVHPIISVRQTILSVFAKCAKMDSTIIPPYLSFISRISGFPSLFSEVLMFSIDLFPDITQEINGSILCECICQHLKTKEKLSNEESFRPFIFDSLSKIVTISELRTQIINNDIISTIVLENAILDDACKEAVNTILEKTIDNYKQSDAKILQSPFFKKSLKFIKDNEQYVSLFSSVMESVSVSDGFSNFIYTHYFQEVVDLFGVHANDGIVYRIFRMMNNSLVLHELSKIDFSKLLENVVISKQTYEVFLGLISRGEKYESKSSVFTGVNNAQTHELIKKILESEFFTDFLTKMDDITKNSIVQCFECNKYKFTEILIGFIPKVEKEEDLTLLLSVFSNISKNISSRPNLFSYFRLFTVDGEKRSRHADQLIGTLAKTIYESQEATNDVLQFKVGSGKIVIPAFQMKSSGLTINIYANICCIESDVDLIVFESDEKVVAKLILGKNRITFECGNEKKSVDFAFTLNTWQSITFTIIQTSLSIYVEGKFIRLLKVPPSFSSEQFSSVSFFNDQMSGQCNNISLYSIPADDRLLQEIINDTSEYLTIVREPSLMMLYSAKFAKGGTLTNVIQNSYGNATSTCENLPFVASLKRIFESSKGLQYFITLFSQVDFLNYEGKKDIEFTNALIDSLALMMKCSENIQKSMLTINAFGVISYFLYLMKSFEASIFDHIFILEPAISNKDLLKQFQKSILLNHDLWMHGSCSINDYLIGCQRSMVCNPQLFHSSVSFFRLIELYYTYASENKLKEQQYELFKYIMIGSAGAVKFDDSHLSVLQQLIIYFKDNDAAAIPLVKVVKKIAKNDRHIWESILQIELMSIHSLAIQTTVIKSLPKDFISNGLFILLEDFIKQDQENQNRIFDYFEEKAKRKLNLVLVVFAIAFAFVNQERRNEAIALAKACFETKTADATKIDPTAFVIIILFFIFSANEEVKTLANLLSHSINAIDQFYQLTMLMSDISSMDFKPFMSSILSALTEIIFKSDNMKLKNDFFEYAVKLIFMNRKHSAIVEHTYNELSKVEIKSFILLLSSYTTVSTSQSSNEYGLSFDNEGQWIDESVALKLLKYTRRDFDESVFDSLYYMCLMAVLFSRNITNEKKQFLKDNFKKALKSQYSAPLILNIFSSNDVFDFATIKSISSDVQQTATEVMEQFYKKVSVENVIHFTFSSKIDIDEIKDSESLMQVISQTRKHELDVFNFYKHDWHRLWQTVSYERSPFLNSDTLIMKQHYKIGSHYDMHMTPFLMVKNNNFDVHADASIKRGGITEEKYQELMISDATKKQENAHFLFEREKPEENKFKVGDNLWTASAERIKVITKVQGDFYVTNEGYVFTSETKTTVIKRETVKQVFWVWTNQRPESVQIFTNDYKGFLFRFPGQQNHKFVQNLRLCQLPNCTFFQESLPQDEVEKLGLTQKWVKRQISNYDYLIWLNLLSGRSFNDSRIYPVMPLIIKDMNANKIEMTDKFIRDITVNIGYLNPETSKRVDERVQTLEETGQPVFCFASLYSNSYIINHFLIRMEPFTTLHIMLQDGYFDVAARLFISMKDTMERIAGKIGSNREFPPEFYALPEFLVNENHFMFGTICDDEEKEVAVDDAGLPNWAKSPPDYINKQRMVLESEYVTQMLPGWIDLIWGYKVTGQAAKEARNTYDPMIYPDTWKTDNKYIDERAKNALLNTVGQIPHLLFSDPHPPRNPVTATPPQTHAVVLCNIPENIAAIICTGISFEKMKVYAVLDSGRVFCLRLAATNFEIQMQRRVPFPSDKRKIVAIEPQGASENDDAMFAFSKEKSANVSILDVVKRTVIKSKTTPHLSAITCISACKNYILSGGSDACAALWRFDKESIEPVNFIMAHRADITCCYLSEMFGFAVTCSSDFTVIITKLPDFSFLRVIDIVLPDAAPAVEHVVYSPPSSVIVTNILGYIVIFFDQYVESFTMNGTFIGINKLGCNTIKACVIQPHPSEEYILALLSDNQVVLLDQFTMKEVKVVWKGTDKIIDIGFHKDSMNFVLTTDTANAILVPGAF